MIKETGEQIAVVANQIVQARHRLDPRQQKVIAWAIGQITRDDTDFMTHTLSVSEFARLTGSESGSLYREMETVTKSLLRSILEIKVQDGDRRRVAFQWLSRCIYRDGEGTVEIRFHSELKPYLLELRSRFTQLRLNRFFKFRSSFTIRFFERIEMQRGLNRHTWQMSLIELREWLSVEESSYPKFGLFRERILDAAQRELDIKSDWSFTFQTLKTGRKITGVEFTLRQSRAPKIHPARERWKKSKPELKAKVLNVAKNLTRWDNASDSAILEDPSFWEHLPDLFDEVEQGQKTFPLTSGIDALTTTQPLR